MDNTRRMITLSLLTLPAGCAMRPLETVHGLPSPAPSTAAPVRAPALGQSWRYRQLDFFNGQQVDLVHESVASVNGEIVIERRGINQPRLPSEIQAPWGRLRRDPVWDAAQNYEQALPLWPAELEAGQTMSLHTHYRRDQDTFRYAIGLYVRALRWERVSVAAGEFRCLCIERMLRQQHQDFSRIETLRHDTLWLAPEVGRWVLRETWGEYRIAARSPGLEDRFRWELTDWS